MKVYIKDFCSASQEAGNNLLDRPKVKGQFSILGVTLQEGDWGHICEVEPAISIKDCYVTTGDNPHVYHKCCIEEIDFAWLDAHAEIIDEQVVSQTIQYTDDEPFILGQDYIFTVYKVKDGAKKYFFYVKRISNDMIIGKAEKVIEIK